MGGHAIYLFETKTHVRRGVNTLGCRSESLAIDGFTYVIYARMKKKGLDSHLFTIYLGADLLDLFTDTMY